MVGAHASAIERAAAADAQGLFAAATGTEPAIVTDEEPPGIADVFLGTPNSASRTRAVAAAQPAAVPGAYRISHPTVPGPRVMIVGHDGEGARNGLYAWMESLGFGFFRDGASTPALSGAMPAGAERLDQPGFRWRGDMIWDFYLGPRRYCCAMWGEAEWEQALLYMARNRMNFLEYYPPLNYIYRKVFPAAKGLEGDGLWQVEAKHALAQKILNRARTLGIHCMYVLTYGAFPEPVQALYPDLMWRNGFLCAHQPELRTLTQRTWGTLIAELGTDHWYAIRHRGEENQVYGDPCRSVTKAEGYRQAFAVMDDIDPKARITVWTWSEQIPQLFADFPERVRAVHIRHGMADVFSNRGAGREQGDGRPALPRGRRWLSGQFTVFGGSETSLQTGWCDAAALARDAQASATDPDCEGYFQWPEWSNTSPWLSHVIAKLSWQPEDGSFDGDAEEALAAYARVRHGRYGQLFMAAFGPLMRDGHARFMHTPRKRLLCPHTLTPRNMTLLAQVRAATKALRDVVGAHRDVVDLMTWFAVRQAHALEAAGYLRHVAGLSAAAELAQARQTWTLLSQLLGQMPELSIVAAVREAGRADVLSSTVDDTVWRLGCDFYHGYPLVMSPEAIELVYLPQLAGLERAISVAAARGETAQLAAAGWFWHDFADPGWADAVRRLPSEDAAAFERTMRARIRAATEARADSDGTDMAHAIDISAADELFAIALPDPVHKPPILPLADPITDHDATDE